MCGLLLCCITANAQEIEVYKAKTIEPYHSGKILADTARKTPAKSTSSKPSSEPGVFFGIYQYWVPGTSYTVPDYNNNWQVLHNSAGTGVLPGSLKIEPAGTYIWNSSWDGKIIKGKWTLTGDKDYPIELVNAQQSRNWKVGKANEPGLIIIWDGSTWYNGKKVKMRK